MWNVSVNCICCTPWIIRAVKIANAGANKFNAVPLIVWSAFILIEANAWSRENNPPATATIKIASNNNFCPLILSWKILMKKIPTKAPMTIIPSIAMLMTPLRSEYIAPIATIRSGIAKYIVCWITKYTTLIICPPSYSFSQIFSCESCRSDF